MKLDNLTRECRNRFSDKVDSAPGLAKDISLRIQRLNYIEPEPNTTNESSKEAAAAEVANAATIQVTIHCEPGNSKISGTRLEPTDTDQETSGKTTYRLLRALSKVWNHDAVKRATPDEAPQEGTGYQDTPEELHFLQELTFGKDDEIISGKTSVGKLRQCADMVGNSQEKSHLNSRLLPSNKSATK